MKTLPLIVQLPGLALLAMANVSPAAAPRAGSRPGAAAVRTADSKPNVLLVIADDQGYGDMSGTGNPVLRTPEMDKLYRESIRLTDYHVNPTCSPSRGALMSGHSADEAGTWHTVAGRSLLRVGQLTLGQVFADSGYATGLFGKWHLGDDYPFRPEDRGFQEVVRIGGGGDGQTPDYWNNAYFDDVYYHDGKPQQYHGYCTDVFFHEAERYIAACQAWHRPFFVYLATNAAHSPFLCPEKYWKPIMARGVPKPVACFLGMIANIDENVGRLRRWLARRGLARNTILIYTSDNGTAAGQKVYNAGMRGHKGSALDGGHRVPFFIYWPDGGLVGGRDINHITEHVDVLPTLIDLCGLRKPANYHFDGRSLVPLLYRLPTPWPDRILVTDSQRIQMPVKWRGTAVMTDRWRLVDNNQLYDIKKDPAELTNVMAQHPDVVRTLRAWYDAWWNRISPGFKPYARIELGNDADNPTRLTCHDWHNPNLGIPWNQHLVREGYPATGFWAVRVDRAGWYQFELRRWPPEANLPIRAAVPPGKPEPGTEAFRVTPGKSLPFDRAMLDIGGIHREKPVRATDKAVTFRVKLAAGGQKLVASFKLPGVDGKVIGAYYVTVTRL